jgi:kynureninase
MVDVRMEAFQDQAERLDRQDPLAGFRERFAVPDESLLYMDGNSLGRMPVASRDHVQRVMDDQWADGLIRSWGEDWYQAPTRIGNKLGQLIGARPGEVVISDSTSVNLYKLVMSALALREDRLGILSDQLNFPTDLYVLQSAVRTLGRGHQITLLESPDQIGIRLDDFRQALSEDTALVTFSTPTFKSGFLHPIQEMTRMAHEAGALVLWDFSHAAGAVPLNLAEWEIDFAVGCTYKYLNGGPGSPAFLYVRADLQEEALGHPWGWWGHTKPFDFDLEFTPDESIRRFLVGTPPVLSTTAIEPALDLVLEAGMDSIRAKSVALGEYFLELFDSLLVPVGYSLGSPRNAEQRGSHISVRHPEGYRITQALIQDENLIPDFREPDNIRLGFAPLYTSFAELLQTALGLKKVVETESYQRYGEERAAVR